MIKNIRTITLLESEAKILFSNMHVQCSQNLAQNGTNENTKALEKEKRSSRKKLEINLR